MTQKEKPEILLIVLDSAQSTKISPNDRLGGEEQGLIDRAQKLISKKVNVEDFAGKLSDSISKAADIMQSTFKNRLGGYSIDQISLSLAITGEGDIGIATAGVEASVTITLKQSDPL